MVIEMPFDMLGLVDNLEAPLLVFMTFKRNSSCDSGVTECMFRIAQCCGFDSLRWVGIRTYI